MLIPCENISGCVKAAPYISLALLCRDRQSFGAKRTSDIIQPQVGQEPAGLPPPLPPTRIYLRPSVQSTGHSNKYQIIIQHTRHTLLSPRLRPSSLHHRTCREQLLNIWTDGQFHNGPPSILLNYILQPSAEQVSSITFPGNEKSSVLHFLYFV